MSLTEPGVPKCQMSVKLADAKIVGNLKNSKVRLHILGSEALGQRVPNILGKPIGSLCYAHRLHLCCCWCNYPKLPRALLLHYIRGPNRLVTIYCTINCRLVALQRQWYTHYRGGGPLLHRGAEFGRSSQETCWRNNFCFCNFKFYSMKAEPSPTCWLHSVMITNYEKSPRVGLLLSITEKLWKFAEFLNYWSPVSSPLWRVVSVK